MSDKAVISYEEFSKMDLRIGKIVKAEPVPQSRNLIKLSIDVGKGEIKQGVAGIAKIYASNELEGKQVAVLNNLQPRRIFGILAAEIVVTALIGVCLAGVLTALTAKYGAAVIQSIVMG